MRRNSHHCGKIAFRKLGHKKSLKSFNFNLPNKSFSVSETLMSEFQGLNLSNEEKGKLSRNLREYMCIYTHITEKDISTYRKQLIKELRNYSDETLVISASELGAFICLAAIFSGELPQNVSWHFELKEFALPLFPKELVKKKSAAQSYDVSLVFSKEGWVRPFPTLCKVPHYMHLRSNIDHEELAA